MRRMRREKPWGKLGILRATRYRQGKPTDITQEAAEQLIYTSAHGIGRVRRVVRQADEKVGADQLARFRVARRKAKKVHFDDDLDD
jgi:hypothetical protein